MTRQNLALAPTATSAINYDYAMAFPRTHTDLVYRPTGEDAVERLVSFAESITKDDHIADTELNLLNHRLPMTRAENNPGKQCEQCGSALGRSAFSIGRSAKRMHCRYCGRLLCGNCCDRSFVVPSYILVKGDFQPHAVCPMCEEHIQKHLSVPLVEFSRLSDAAIKAFGVQKIRTIDEHRQRLQHLIFFFILPGESQAECRMMSQPHQRIFPAAHIGSCCAQLTCTWADGCDRIASCPLSTRLPFQENPLGTASGVHFTVHCYFPGYFWCKDQHGQPAGAADTSNRRVSRRRPQTPREPHCRVSFMLLHGEAMRCPRPLQPTAVQSEFLRVVDACKLSLTRRRNRLQSRGGF